MLKKIIAFLTRTQIGHEAIPQTKTVLTDEREKAIHDMNLSKEREERERTQWQEEQKEKKEETPGQESQEI